MNVNENAKRVNGKKRVKDPHIHRTLAYLLLRVKNISTPPHAEQSFCHSASIREVENESSEVVPQRNARVVEASTNSEAMKQEQKNRQNAAYRMHPSVSIEMFQQFQKMDMSAYQTERVGKSPFKYLNIDRRRGEKTASSAVQGGKPKKQQ